LQHQFYGLILAAADEATDLLDAAAAHIEVVDANKHIAWLQLASGLSRLISDELFDVQVVVSSNFEHDAQARVRWGRQAGHCWKQTTRERLSDVREVLQIMSAASKKISDGRQVLKRWQARGGNALFQKETMRCEGRGCSSF
jgi:hypothetical protein